LGITTTGRPQRKIVGIFFWLLGLFFKPGVLFGQALNFTFKTLDDILQLAYQKE
jgi:hypothetical protein